MQGNVDEAELTTIGYMHMCIYSQAGHVARRNGHPSSESSPVLFSSIRTFAGVFLRNGIGPDDLKIRELIARVDQGDVDELIIATNPGQEGDATTFFIKRELEGKPVNVTGLARGLPVGSDIEYADSITLMRALQGRRAL